MTVSQDEFFGRSPVSPYPESASIEATLEPTFPAEPVMTKADSWQSFLVRAGKTFLQGATAVLLANSLGFFEATAWEAALTGGFGAVVSFLNNWASAAEAPKPTVGQ